MSALDRAAAAALAELAEHLRALQRRADAAEAERDRLRAALEKYGEHGVDEHGEQCDEFENRPDSVCTCGYAAALRPAQEGRDG